MANLIQRQRGLSLVELMVAVTIGLLVTAAITAVFLQTKVSSGQDENISRMQENARFALSLIRNDLLHADFFGNATDGAAAITSTPNPLTTLPTPTSDCDNGGAQWLYNVAASPQNRLGYLYDATPSQVHAAYGCIATADVKNSSDGTDVLAIQRVMASPTSAPAAADNKVYIRSNKDIAQLFHNDGGTSPAITGATDWEYLAHVYYVNPDNVLYREYLQTGPVPTMTAEPLVDGIERFHVEFGIDCTPAATCSGDGTADFYTPTPGTDTGNIVSARLFVLARSPDADPRQQDNKTYQLGSETTGPFNDHYYRRVYTTTVMLRNFSYQARLGRP